MNGYTGKTNGVSFRLPAGTRRQAREYLLSRGFDKAANEKLQCDAFALAWRDGGTYDLGQLSAKAAFSARTTERAFNRLVTGGLCDVDPPSAKPRLARLRLALPVVKDYYEQLSSRYIQIADVRDGGGYAGKKVTVKKWLVRAVDWPADPRAKICFAMEDEPGIQQLVSEAEAWKQFAKLRSGGGAS
jgi:hypothetical protein